MFDSFQEFIKNWQKCKETVISLLIKFKNLKAFCSVKPIDNLLMYFSAFAIVKIVNVNSICCYSFKKFKLF